ncbi:MAG: PQQ-binding-like beta-propeller repeat protein, partial [Thermoguttaceae bacterium]
MKIAYRFTVLLAILAMGATAEGRADLAELPGVAGGQVRGLVVHLGTSDGKLELQLAASGKALVHGLAVDTAGAHRARQAIARAGLYGVASAETWAGGELPYGDQLVNLLIADLDALGEWAPRREEILRVLAPGGAACLRTGGAWQRTTKPFPAEMDDWRYYLHDPSGNPVSRDRLVGPATTLRWINSYAAVGGSTEGGTGYRIADGLAFHHLQLARKGASGPLVARDALNGLPLWRRESTNMSSRAEMVAKDGKLFALVPDGKQDRYSALDEKTGEILKVYDRVSFAGVSGKQVRAMHMGGLIVLTNGTETLTALDEATGEVRWTFRDSDSRPFFPVLDADHKRLFVALAQPKPGYEVEHWSRWPGVVAEAIVALDAATGKTLWRNTDLRGRIVGQLLIDGD